MADIRKHVRVFLASPGDLAEERRLAKSAVDEFNNLFSESFGYQVDLVGWEDTVSVFGRPQAIINSDLAKCELFVGAVWKKWGTPPNVEGPYTSGFEEEFRTSLERRNGSGSPEMSLFFKDISEELLRDPGEQLRKVIAFKQELIDGKYLLFETFSEPRAFERKFFRCIAQYVKRIADEENGRTSNEVQASKGGSPDSVSKKAAYQPLLSQGAVTFARRFLDFCEEGRDTEVMDADIARFRLLATLIKKVNNDVQYLGVHDANILYSSQGDHTLDNLERFGLLLTGLANFSNENTPVWRWIASFDSYDDVLTHLSCSDEASVQSGALEAMRFLECQIPSEANRLGIVALWLGEKRASGAKIAAIKYLSVCGLKADVELLRAEFDLNNVQTAYAAAEAIVRISLQDGRSSAISALYGLRPISMSKDLVEVLFGVEPEALSDELIIAGAEQPSEEVRFAVVSVGFSRKLFTLEQCEELLKDDSSRIRFLAIDYLLDNGRALSESEISEIFTRPGHASGLLGGETRDYADEVKRLVVRKCSDEELEEKAKKESAFRYDANIALVERRFKERGDELRKWVDDGFRGVFSKGLESLSKSFPGDQRFLSDVRSLEAHITKTNMRLALDAIYRVSNRCDLNLVRRALSRKSIKPSSDDFEFLGKHGDWSDVKLVLELAREIAGVGSLLISPRSGEGKAAANCLFRLGRHRSYELLFLDMADSIRVDLALLIPNSLLVEFSDDQLLSLLHIESDSFRRIMAIKSVIALPKHRATSILHAYIGGNSFRFYNVVFWLDLGTSFSRRVAIRAARVALQRS